MSVGWDDVSELRSPVYCLSPRSMESHSGMILTGKTEELGEKPVPVPLSPPQIPHGLTQVQTRSSALKGQQLTTWAITLCKFWTNYTFLKLPLELQNFHQNNGVFASERWKIHSGSLYLEVQIYWGLFAGNRMAVINVWKEVKYMYL
jgi:hypothetical protein